MLLCQIDETRRKAVRSRNLALAWKNVVLRNADRDPSGGEYLILETKGFDELAGIKAEAAERWVTAVNADGKFGRWRYTMARSVPAVREILDSLTITSA